MSNIDPLALAIAAAEQKLARLDESAARLRDDFFGKQGLANATQRSLALRAREVEFALALEKELLQVGSPTAASQRFKRVPGLSFAAAYKAEMAKAVALATAVSAVTPAFPTQSRQSSSLCGTSALTISAFLSSVSAIVDHLNHPGRYTTTAPSFLSIFSAPAGMRLDGVAGIFRLQYFPYTRHLYAVLTGDGAGDEAPVYCIDGDTSYELCTPTDEDLLGNSQVDREERAPRNAGRTTRRFVKR